MIEAREILSTAAMTVLDFRCSAGPDAAPYLEQHRNFSLSYVRKGSFGCHTQGRLHELVAGSILVGRPDAEYMCTHEHHRCGDECLSFQFAPAFIDEIGGETPIWQSGAVPPLAELMVLGELAQAAGDGASDIGADEAGILLALRFLGVVSGCADRRFEVTAKDRRRAVAAAQWIEAHAQDAVTLEDAASFTGLSSFHFLRIFAKALGLTPHQYLLRTRLRMAAALLAEEDRTITDIAFETGFGDLSNFIRSFGLAAGLSPRRFRELAKGDRKILQDRLGAPLLS